MTAPDTSNRLLKAASDRLASVRFAVVVVTVIALASVLGTVLPQGPDVAGYLAKHPGAEGRVELWRALGLTHVFSSWWFMGLLGLLAASMVACSSRRWATVRRTAGFARRRAFGSMLTHVSFLLILAGAVTRGVWGDKGRLELREGETRTHFVGKDGPQALPFAVHLDRFEIETYRNPQGGAATASGPAERLLVVWPQQKLKAALPIKIGVAQSFGAFRLTVLKYLPDFTYNTETKEATSRSATPRNPAVLVAVKGPSYHNHRWLFARHPGFQMHAGAEEPATPSPLEMVYQDVETLRRAEQRQEPIKSFRSSVKIFENGRVEQEPVIEVNRPFAYRGYRFYQTGYNPDDLTYTSLQVVRDPGVPLVYSGFSLMMVGLFIVFYLNPWLANWGRKP